MSFLKFKYMTLIFLLELLSLAKHDGCNTEKMNDSFESKMGRVVVESCIWILRP